MTNLLYSTTIPIDEEIYLRIPTVGEVLDSNGMYDTICSSITATPRDLMVELDDMGIDYNDIEEYELFLLMFQSLKGLDASILFGDLDLTLYEMAENENGEIVIQNQHTGNYIDKFKYRFMCEMISKMNYTKRNNKKAGNEAARRYLIEKERRKKKRAKNKMQNGENPMNSLIISLVNAPEFKYDYQSVRDITIYQFNSSLHQIVDRVSFDKLMIGVYAGTVDTSKMSPKSLTWIKQN